MNGYQPPDDGPFDMYDPTPASEEDIRLISGWIYQYLFDDGELSSLIELAVETYRQQAKISIQITPQLLARVESHLQERIASKLKAQSAWKTAPEKLIGHN